MRPARWPAFLAPFFALIAPVEAQTPTPDAFVSWVRAHAVPLPACGAQSDGSDSLGVVAPIVGDARVVALGEPAHGAHQPLEFRNCLFRYLVEHRGFTAIAIESGLAESRRLQAYVAGGPGDPRRLVGESLTWGFGRFDENVELVVWMHRYNADPARRRKIRFYGIDMSGSDRGGGWRNAPKTLDASLSWLARVAPERSRRVRQAIAPFRAGFTQRGYLALSPSDRTRLRAAIARLIAFFDRERPFLVKASNAGDFAWARRNAVLASQLEAIFRVSRPPDSGDDLQPDDYRADAMRDAAMADNVRWVIDREGAAGRILVFAHDGHVMNAPTRGGIWSVYRRAPKSMGQHLRAALGDRLRIIATTASAIAPGLASEGQPPGTFDRALSEGGRAPFVIDLRSVDRGVAATWLGHDQSMRTNFSTESIFVPSESADAFAVFAVLTPHMVTR
jgi:erythromycin esterase